MKDIKGYCYANREIGRGAFAVVYHGRNKETNTDVAIKSIAKKNGRMPKELLDKEIQILEELKGLKHDNLVSLLDCVVSSTHVYLILEFCDSGNLAQFLFHQKKLDEKTIQHFFVQIAHALEALNTKSIVHRDLKPQNILLCKPRHPITPVPINFIIKLCDFGLSRVLPAGEVTSSLCGSPLYMAPEIISSMDYGQKADLFSVGVIMYQCAFGIVPFEHCTPLALKNYYEHQTELRLNIPNFCSPCLCDLLIALLKKQPVDRIEFNSFFTHPFFTAELPTASTVPSSSNSLKHRDGKTLPFQCDVCSLKFATSSNLKAHQTRHTGEKPFKCELCGDRFPLKHHLTRHHASHSDARQLQRFFRKINETLTWMGEKLKKAKDQCNLDSTNIREELLKQANFEQELFNRLDATKAIGQKLIHSGHEAKEDIQARLNALEKLYTEIVHVSGMKGAKLLEMYNRSIEDVKQCLSKLEELFASEDTGKDLIEAHILQTELNQAESDYNAHLECIDANGDQDLQRRIEALREPLQRRKQILAEAVCGHIRDIDDDIAWMREHNGPSTNRGGVQNLIKKKAIMDRRMTFSLLIGFALVLICGYYIVFM